MYGGERCIVERCPAALGETEKNLPDVFVRSS